MGVSLGGARLAFVLAAAGWAGVCAGGATVPAVRSLNPVRFETAPRLPPVRLVAGGEAPATIVVRPVVDPREKGVPLKGYAGISCSVATAAEELQRYVKETTGVLLPIGAEMPPAGPVILVGRSEYTDRLKIRVDRLKPSGFVVARIDRGVAIVGRDANANADWYAESGTLWGVYDFIERFLGVRWYYPGPLGTVVPHVEELTVPAVRYTDAPHFAKRRYGRFHGTLRTPLPPSADMFPHVGAKYRNEDLAGIPVAAHTTRNWISLYGETHPEYFEVGRDGARVSGNLCYSHPGVLVRFL